MKHEVNTFPDNSPAPPDCPQLATPWLTEWLQTSRLADVAMKAHSLKGAVWWWTHPGALESCYCEKGLRNDLGWGLGGLERWLCNKLASLPEEQRSVHRTDMMANNSRVFDAFFYPPQCWD